MLITPINSNGSYMNKSPKHWGERGFAFTGNSEREPNYDIMWAAEMSVKTLVKIGEESRKNILRFDTMNLYIIESKICKAINL